MEIDTEARVYALELLTTQLISEYLRTVPDPPRQIAWARERLAAAAAAMPVEAASLDAEARLRLAVGEHLARILDLALAQALATPMRLPAYDLGPGTG